VPLRAAHFVLLVLRTQRPEGKGKEEKKNRPATHRKQLVGHGIRYRRNGWYRRIGTAVNGQEKCEDFGA
jgi:hypothetical protein